MIDSACEGLKLRLKLSALGKGIVKFSEFIWVKTSNKCFAKYFHFQLSKFFSSKEMMALKTEATVICYLEVGGIRKLSWFHVPY